MPLDIFGQSNQIGQRSVHPILLELMKKQMSVGKQKQPMGSMPPPSASSVPVLPIEAHKLEPSQEQQPKGLLDSIMGSIMGPAMMASKIGGDKKGGNTIFPPSTGVDNSWWNSGKDYQVGGKGYQNVYNGPFSGLFGSLFGGGGGAGAGTMSTLPEYAGDGNISDLLLALSGTAF